MFSYSLVGSLASLALLVQSVTNKYDAYVTFFTALFAFLSMLAGIFGPVLAAKFTARRADAKAEEVKAELKMATTTATEELKAQTAEVKTIVNGNTERMQRKLDELTVENERLRNAKS